MSIPLILVEWAEKSDCFTPTSLLLFPFSILQISTRPLERPIATSFSLQFYIKYLNYPEKLFPARFSSMISFYLKNLISMIRSFVSIWIFSFDSSSVWIRHLLAPVWSAYLFPSGPQRTLSGCSLKDFVNAGRPFVRSQALRVLSLAIVRSNLPLGSAEKSRTGHGCLRALISSQSSSDHILKIPSEIRPGFL